MASVEDFTTFLQHVREASPDDYIDALHMSAQRHELSDERMRSEFQKMQEHILHYYEGVQPVGSFLTPAGEAVDCVPVAQQPTARAAKAAGIALAGVAPAPTPSAHSIRQAPIHHSAPEVHKHLCPLGNIPLPRITLERMIQYGTLDRYFQKVSPRTGVEEDGTA
jgi:hypothetical protein